MTSCEIGLSYRGLHGGHFCTTIANLIVFFPRGIKSIQHCCRANSLLGIVSPICTGISGILFYRGGGACAMIDSQLQINSCSSPLGIDCDSSQTELGQVCPKRKEGVCKYSMISVQSWFTISFNSLCTLMQ